MTATNGYATHDAALDYLERGLPITICDGKKPLGIGWDVRQNGRVWGNIAWRTEDIDRVFNVRGTLNVGLKVGPGGLIDIEADSADEEQAFADLFAGCDIPITPTFESKRGKHRLFAWHPALEKTGKAVVYFGNAKLGIRIGADHKAAHSCVPPSVNDDGSVRRWLVGLDDCDPAPLPDQVIARILAAATDTERKKKGTTSVPLSANGKPTTPALEAMLRIKPDEGEHDGSKRLLAVACRAVEHDLTDNEAVAAIRQYEAKHPFPRSYGDNEIVARLRDAEKRVARGSAIIIANYKTIEIEDEDGEKKTVTVPVSMNDIIDTINQRMNNWPRRVDNMLFVDDPKHSLDYFDRRTTAGMFGWLRRHNKVQWAKGGNVVSQAELFAEIERTAQRYEAIELLPHEPPIANIYYRGESPEPGDGSHLRQLLDRFRPETTIDRDLIQAAMMTAFWGGLPGCRPAFVVTSDDGRGVGKSKVPETIGYLCGGHIDVSAGEDIEQLKTRMLTPGARTKRIALMDNVKSLRLSWAELEAMITSPIISGRQLYVGEGQRPNLLTWFITLNGVSMATDMAQRSVIIKVVKGKNDGPWWEQTRQFIDRHRAELIGDIIGALRAEPFPLAEFSRWATWEQHVLCRLPEPGEAQRLILERQAEANCEMDEAEIIEEFFANKLWGLKYHFRTAQVRIPVEIAAQWFSVAVGERTKTAAVTRRLNQMAKEGQLNRIAPDSTRTYGRCFVWTGENANVMGEPIDNDLRDRIAAQTENRREF